MLKTSYHQLLLQPASHILSFCHRKPFILQGALHPLSFQGGVGGGEDYPKKTPLQSPRLQERHSSPQQGQPKPPPSPFMVAIDPFDSSRQTTPLVKTHSLSATREALTFFKLSFLLRLPPIYVQEPGFLLNGTAKDFLKPFTLVVFLRFPSHSIICVPRRREKAVIICLIKSTT